MFEDDPQANGFAANRFAAKEAVIDAALDAMPVYPAPAGFRHRVIFQVQRLQVERSKGGTPETSFRLDFLDFVLPVFFAFFSMLGLAALLLVLSLLDPLRLARIQLAVQALVQRMPNLPQGMLWLFFGASLAGLVLALIVACLWLAPVRLDMNNRTRI